jgi:hypothetical protein
MEPILPPETLQVYALIKQTGISLSLTGYAASAHSIGTGFFLTRSEAEYQRTVELLKDTATPRSLFHVYELDIPNPAYQE